MPSGMQIPKRLAYVLERDQALDGAVKLSVSQFEPWIKHSNLPFFPEYTKHGIEHIQAALRTATGLICDNAWEAITPSDAAVLVLSVLLHDCAMHLSEDGFISLLGEERRDKSVTGMVDKPWNVLWEEFYGEASRFDGRKLIGLFGDTQPVRRPPLDPNELTKRDRLLIGEFLRRHHPRLAQEIVFFGVPTKGSVPLVLEGFSGTADHIAGLSGIVARSHGASVRACLPYLQANFDVRQYKGVHPVFLMTLLRVADYLQIEVERAPVQVLQVKQLTSPVSQGEWKAHHAIKDVRHTHEDPEALFVDAFPEDVKTFFRVESWLRGIQEELDASWAVLGEVYGRYEGLNRLGLILRRVRSSIDDARAFSKKVTYLPIKAAFRGSDADLLKLLIEPLYGNRPEVGLRELIQNAVDAVREIEQYRKDVPTVRHAPQPTQDSDVIVVIEKGDSGEAWITVSDKGIGMTPEIVVDYFLTAGASFRRSEDWRRVFETSEGKSKVLRAGRFGVGALASFLVGPEIEVSTRHADEPEGVEFKASVDSDTIELRRISRPVGTTIKIRITAALAERLAKPKPLYEYHHAEAGRINWDWYCLSKPSVARTALGGKLEQEHHLPDHDEVLPPLWRQISHPDYAGVLWSYSTAPALVCNGIEIRQSTYDYRGLVPEAKWYERFGLRLPNVAVFDPDGRLPLNLQRSGLVESLYPFDEVLANDVIRDFIAFSLVHGPTSLPNRHNDKAFRYEGSNKRGIRECGDFYFTAEGFGYGDAYLLHNGRFKSLLVAVFGTSNDATRGLAQCGASPVIPQVGFNDTSEADEWLRAMFEYGGQAEGPISTSYYSRRESANWGLCGVRVLDFLKRRGSRVLVPDWLWERATTKSKKLAKRLLRSSSVEWTRNRCRLLRIGNCPQPGFDFDKFAGVPTANEVRSTVAEVYLDIAKEPKPSPVATKWIETLHVAEIPYDLKLRREKLKHAFEELLAYVHAHEAAKKQQGQKR